MLATRSPRLPLLAAAEWLLVLPASVFLATAVLRVLQPPQYQPARTSLFIFNWTTAHISRLGAAALFVALPALVAISGCAIFYRLWRTNSSLREDVAVGFSILRRNFAVGMLFSGVLLAAAILAFSILHIITD